MGFKEKGEERRELGGKGLLRLWFLLCIKDGEESMSHFVLAYNEEKTKAMETER